MKKIAVVLSGCGFKDGSEITEAVSAIVVLSKLKAEVEFYSVNLDVPAVDHFSGVTTGTRNTLSESARIARGRIKDLTHLKSKDFDGVVFPGGNGAASNLSSWSTDGANCKVHPEVWRTLVDFYDQEKPICAFCIAPALVARVLGEHQIEVTIGNDPEIAKEIERTGATHVTCKVDDFVTDRRHKIISTPAYMYEADPHEVYRGIKGAIKEFIEMA